jgi:hypothetical protein
VKELESMSNKPLTSLYAIILYSAFTLSIALLPARAHAQAAQPPATPAAPPEPVAPVVTIIGEEYRVELSAGAWFTMPSAVTYSDTENVTSGTTTTTVTGTNIDYKKDLGLQDKVFPEVHLTIRLAPKHKLRGEYIPIFYKESATLAADLNFNGQAYLKGQAVDSTLRWNEWHVGYEFDVLTADRGYLGGIAAASSLNVSGALANTVQSGTASVNILMPGLGATARYYPASRVSVTGEVLFFDLPGGATSTHGHIVQIDGYATFNFTKHAGVKVGYRSFDTTHVFGSPLNTGSMTIRGPYVGGTAHF